MWREAQRRAQPIVGAVVVRINGVPLPPGTIITHVSWKPSRASRAKFGAGAVDARR